LENGHDYYVDVSELVLKGIACCSIEKVSYREVELPL
jgi:hypothetical protein